MSKSGRLHLQEWYEASGYCATSRAKAPNLVDNQSSRADLSYTTRQLPESIDAGKMAFKCVIWDLYNHFECIFQEETPMQVETALSLKVKGNKYMLLF
jgi:hypothetical protein